MLTEIGVRRGDVYVTNVVKHRPTRGSNGTLSNRRPTADEIKACGHAWLYRQIELINPKLIVPLGDVALHRFRPSKYKITEVHGQLFVWDRYKVIPTFHPAYVLRNRRLILPFRKDFKIIRDVYRRV